MKTSETVRESRGIFLKFSARLRSSARSVSGSNSGLTCSELCGGTSWDTATLPEIRPSRGKDDLCRLDWLAGPGAHGRIAPEHTRHGRHSILKQPMINLRCDTPEPSPSPTSRSPGRSGTG